GMARQPRCRPRFTHEALHRALVIGEPLGQQLDRDVAPERVVTGTPDRRHSPRGDVAQGLITFWEPQVRADAHVRGGSITHRNASLPVSKNTNPRGPSQSCA